MLACCTHGLQTGSWWCSQHPKDAATTAILEFWDTENANLINSCPSLVAAMNAIRTALEAGSTVWAEDAALVIKLESGGEPYVLATGPELIESIRPAEVTRA
jgi:hypothetical protein